MTTTTTPAPVETLDAAIRIAEADVEVRANALTKAEENLRAAIARRDANAADLEEAERRLVSLRLATPPEPFR